MAEIPRTTAGGRSDTALPDDAPLGHACREYRHGTPERKGATGSRRRRISTGPPLWGLRCGQRSLACMAATMQPALFHLIREHERRLPPTRRSTMMKRGPPSGPAQLAKTAALERLRRRPERGRPLTIANETTTRVHLATSVAHDAKRDQRTKARTSTGPPIGLGAEPFAPRSATPARGTALDGVHPAEMHRVALACE
jgi:hypothetical protein